MVGGGFVGLHTAVHAALKGVEEVLIIDINEDVVDRINSGNPDKLHVREPYILDNWDRVKERIRATTDYAQAGRFKHFIVAVQTPRRGNTVDFTPLRRVAESLAPQIPKGSLIVSETTIYPGGTMEPLAKPLADLTGYRLDEELLVAHVPERLVSGSKEWTPENIPRVVGAIGPRSLEKVLRLYRDCLGVKVHPVSDIRVAEAAKLLENSFRLVNIALVNELKRYLDSIGVDIREVIKAASTKPFGYMPFYPSPYAGGACIPKDSLMLEQASNSLLLRVARHVNETQPQYYAALLHRRIRELRARKILFYGLGFKPNSPYPIDSPILRLIEELRKLDPTLDIRRYDPQIPELSDFRNEGEAVEWADIVVRWGYKDRKLKGVIIEVEQL